MAWQDEMVDILRTMVNDTAGSKYTDDRLQEVLTVAARLVGFDADFRADYLVDRPNLSIAPDPTTSVPRDEAFIDLVTVRAAAMLDQGAAAVAAGQAILVEDVGSKIDLREAFKAQLSLFQKGWGAVYDRMLGEYLAGQQSGSMGAVILSPFRYYRRGPGGYGAGGYGACGRG
jgi:hypothetical protein